MNWKSWLSKPSAVLSALAVFTGLLVNFQGAMAQVANAIPAISAFIPLIALGGTTFFSLWALSIAAVWIWNRMPSHKFGACSSEVNECLQLVHGAIRYWPYNNPGGDPWPRLIELSKRLEKLNIPFPAFDTAGDEEKLEEWFQFLKDLGPLANRCELSRARNLIPTEGERCCMDRGGDGIPPFPSRSVRRCVRTQAVRVRSLCSELSGRTGSP